MVNSIGFIGVLVCMIGVGSITPSQSMQELGIQKEVVSQAPLEVALKVDLCKVLISIEETLNYSSQIEILDLKYKGNVLYIDLSDDLIQYGGGTCTEYYIGETLLAWGFETTDAEFISLLIEGQADAFPEGSLYSLYWREDYLQNMKNE